METFKKISYLAVLSCFFTFLSCKEKKSNQTKLLVQDEAVYFADTVNINKDLKKSSLDFIKNFNYSNRLIEVNINKNEPNQIVISYSCRGIADFEIKKYKPLFSYNLGGNLFFVYTGVEELLNITFDTTVCAKYNSDICRDPKKATYIFENNIMVLDTIGQFPEPFSSLPAPMPPPPIKKNTKNFK